MILILWFIIRKYVRFRKTVVEQESLLDEIGDLNDRVTGLVKENERILAMKVTQIGLKPGESPEEEISSSSGESSGEEEEEEEFDENMSTEGLRFPQLTRLDRKLAKNKIVNFGNTENLEQIVDNFRCFAASKLHLYYEAPLLRVFIAGLACGKMIILQGISGTGKTSLPYMMGKYFQNDTTIASVQPSWRDRTELFGFYNEFTKKFNETEFLRSLYTATYRRDINLIVLDEMNLARIEYYFAEFLSVMEMPNVNEWNVELINTYSVDDPKNVHNGKLLIPQNITFFGTANNDDSTFTISDKVYDRAISLFFDNKGIAFDAEFTEPVNLSYDQVHRLFESAINDFPVSEAVLEKFNELDNFVIAKFKLAFGNRILKQMKAFIPAYVGCGGNEIDGLDFIFTNKILKKFESLNVAFLKDELGELNLKLDELFGEGTFTMAHKYINNLLKMSA